MPTLRVTQETDRGVVLNGMKMLGTSAVFANETWVGNLLPLAPDQARESITCAVPLGQPGVQIWAEAVWPRRLGVRQPAVVEVRRDRLHGALRGGGGAVGARVHPQRRRPVARDLLPVASHCLGNHQSNIRFHELKVMLGVA